MSTALIAVKPNKLARIDSADLPLVLGHQWSLYTREKQRGGAVLYAQTNIEGKTVRMHNLIMGCRGTDHIDGDGLNNRRSNLRAATAAQNNRNTPKLKGCISKYKGVSWRRRKNPWHARIQVNGKRIHLGSFSTEEAAALAYNKAAESYFGQFARLNIIVSGHPAAG